MRHPWRLGNRRSLLGFLLRQRWPVGVGLFQVAFDILVPEVPCFLVVLQNQSIVQDLEIFDLDRRKLVDRRRIPAETAELRLVFRWRLFEQLFVLGRCELVGDAFLGGGKLRRPFNRFAVREVRDWVVTLKCNTVFVDVNDFGGGRENRKCN
jgi:hypothetical protein